MFYNLNADWYDIDLETTTRCNAACPMCFRNLSGDRVNPNLQITDFDIDWLDNIDLPLRTVSLCGNYGDPIISKNLHDIVEKVLSKKFVEGKKIIIMTNGGARTTEWWKELAKIMSNGDKCRVIFGIDGLEDTNHLYRRNVEWHKLMDNVKAFIGAGGRAQWKMLLFKHNQHQVEEAKQKSIDMGFTFFETIITNRFKNVKQKSIYPVYDKLGEHIYDLEEAKIADTDFTPRKKARKEQVWSGKVNCYANKLNSIYMAADGRVYPCPNTGYVANKGQERILEVNRYATDNNIADMKLSQIIKGDFFTAVKQSHNIKGLCMPTCIRTCGKKRDNLLNTQWIGKNAKLLQA